MTERLLNTTNQPMQIPGHRSSGTNFARVAIGQIGQIGWQFIFTRHLSRPYQHRHHRYIAGKGLRDLDTHKICWIVQSGFAAFVQLLPTIANNSDQHIAFTNRLSNMVAKIYASWNVVYININGFLAEPFNQAIIDNLAAYWLSLRR